MVRALNMVGTGKVDPMRQKETPDRRTHPGLEQRAGL